MSAQLQAFLDEWSATQLVTGRELHSGDPTSWMQAWSHDEPVSVFGAGVRARAGWAEVRRTIEWVAGRFGACDHYEYELVVADVHGDLAYTGGFERYTASRPGGEQLINELRVTQIYRREHGVWKLVHRHGDNPPTDPTD